MADTEALRRAADELTLLDYLACAALPAVIEAECVNRDPALPTPAALIARKAYRVAEAMLDERKESARRVYTR